MDLAVSSEKKVKDDKCITIFLNAHGCHEKARVGSEVW